MTNEELLKPRYKVIADYPGNEFTIGQVIQMVRRGVFPLDWSEEPEEVWISEFIESQKGNTMFSEKLFQPHPHLFKKLEWWEDRKPEEMPKYVKDDEGEVQQVKEWTETYMYCYNSGRWVICENIMCFFEPATEEEYSNQNKTQP